MNKFICTGRITTDLELKAYSGGNVLNFTIAVPRVKENSKGQNVDFFRCTAWNGIAETMSKYLSKGKKILLEGKLCCESYENEDEKKYNTFIQVESFEFLEKKETTPTDPSVM